MVAHTERFRGPLPQGGQGRDGRAFQEVRHSDLAWETMMVGVGTSVRLKAT